MGVVCIVVRMEGWLVVRVERRVVVVVEVGLLEEL